MKIKFTCPKCGGHQLLCRTSWESQNENVVLGMDKDEMPIYDENPQTEGYWESPEKEEYRCGNDSCQAPVADVGNPSIDEVIALGLKEGWIEKVEE